MSWGKRLVQTNTSFFRDAEPIVYRPDRGLGGPVATRAILLPQGIAQPSAPGYYCDIEVDPDAVSDGFARGDVVEFSDGKTYQVVAVSRQPYCNVRLALHNVF